MESLFAILFSFIDSPRALAVFLGIVLAVLVFGLLSYIYLSLVFFAIGKRCKINFPRVALVPFFGPMIVAYQASHLPIWPWVFALLSTLGFLLTTFAFFNYLVVTLTVICIIAFTIYLILWNTRMFRILKKPSYFAYSILFFPLYFVLAGIALRRPNYDPMKGGVSNG